MTTLRNDLAVLLVLHVAACAIHAQKLQPLRPLPTLHGSHVEIVQWSGDEEKLTEWARVTGTLTPTGQNPVKEECEFGAKIQAATGCKTIFSLYAFDEGKFPEDAKSWEYAQEQGVPMAAFVSIAYDYRFDFGLDGTNPNAWGRTFDARLTPHEVHRLGQLINVKSRWPSGNTIGVDGLFEFGNVEIKYVFPSPRTLLDKHPNLWPVLWAEYNRGAHLQTPSPDSAFDGLWSDMPPAARSHAE